MKHFVYIIKCSDNSLYTGITKDVTKRIWQHNNSSLGAKAVRGKRPVELVHKEAFETLIEAAKREREIKGWRRDRKIELIKNSVGIISSS